jgi:hypothetical protein
MFGLGRRYLFLVQKEKKIKNNESFFTKGSKSCGVEASLFCKQINSL